MQVVISLLGGLLAVGWGGLAADYFRGARRARTLDEAAPFGPDDAAPPALSVVLAACNEADKLPRAFRSLLAQRYPGPFEIVAVDDRSTDGTGEMLDFLAAEAPAAVRVVVLHVRDLPPGWLGKTHALWQGAQRASGEWLLFTDADVLFAPDCLDRAVAYAGRERLDHLVSFFRLELRGFWEHVFGLCFSFLFFIRFRPWHVRDPKRSNYLGVGGFNLLRKNAYEAIGTHRAIALEVADDMELGRRVKRAGFASDVVGAADQITVRWQEGLGGLMGGLVKNAYAGLDYSPLKVAGSIALLLLTMVWPVAGAFVARARRARAGYAVALAHLFAVGAYHARVGRIPPAYALTLPFSTLLLIGVILRSLYVAEHDGGVTWRGTLYPLAELRARRIPPPPPLVSAE
jgi:glycosyltransferase involved in cell wall biosynthesis